jgi:hypothetical protein
MQIHYFVLIQRRFRFESKEREQCVFDRVGRQ